MKSLGSVFLSMFLSVLLFSQGVWAENFPVTVAIKLNDGSSKKVQLSRRPHTKLLRKSVTSQLVSDEDAMVAQAAFIPPSFQIDRSLVGEVPDQGQRNLCTYFATSGLVDTYLRSHPAQNQTQSPQISEECLLAVRKWMGSSKGYDGDDKPDGDVEAEGDSFNLIAETLRNLGAVENKKLGAINCQYTSDQTDALVLSPNQYKNLEKIDPGAVPGRLLAVKDSYQVTVDQVKALIASGSPVVLDLALFPEHSIDIDWNYDPRVDIPDPKKNIPSFHAILVTGYEENSVTGETIFTFRNSWGPTWGRQGYGTFHQNLLEFTWSHDKDANMILSF